MIFKLEITLGNAAMQDPTDVSDALLRIAMRLDEQETWGELRQSIQDINGNRVGTVWMEEE